MSSMAKAISIDRTSLATLCRRHDIRRLSLFGSVLRPDFRPDSDVDVLVEFEPGQVPGVLPLHEIEEQIRSIFRERGAAPTRDYLSDKGKTRILNYVLPRDQALAVSVCGRLLREAYQTRAEDELRFQFNPTRQEGPP